MAGFSWSNPNQSDQTMAGLGSKFEVQSPNIGPIIAAIMSQRQHKEELERQQMTDLIKGVGSVAGGVTQAYQGGQADDAANLAIYQAKNPNDPYTGQPGFSDRVPDYGGTMGYEAQLNSDKLRKIEEQLSGTGWENDMKRQMMESRIRASDALTAQRQGAGRILDDSIQSSGEIVDDISNYNGTRISAGPQVYEDPVTHERWRQGSGDHWYPLKGTAAPAVAKPMPKADIKHLPPPEQSGVIHDSEYAGAASFPSGGANAPTGGTPSPAQDIYKATGPQQSDIAYLQSHPELAAKFDAQFGQGAAAQYLK